MRMAEIRKIAHLLGRGTSEVAGLTGHINILADAAGLLGFSLRQFSTVLSCLNKIQKPFHEIEQMLWITLEAAPFRFRNVSDEEIVFPDGTVLKPGNIISLDTDERHSGFCRELTDYTEKLEMLHKHTPSVKEAEEGNFTPGW